MEQYALQANKERGSVPLDKIVMPMSLTAENGAKGLLIGEFNERIKVTCPECGGTDGECEGVDACIECDGDGYWWQDVPISWTTIKEIYAMAVKHLAA